MKKVILSLLLVLTLSLSMAAYVYAEPDTNTDTNTNIQTEGKEDKAPTDENSDTTVLTDESSENAENAFDIKTIIVMVWGVAVLALLIVIVAKSGNKKKFEKLEKQLKEAAQNRDTVYDKVSYIERDVNIIKSQLDSVSRELSYASSHTQSYTPEPEPVQQPQVELTFEEKVDRALSDGTMASLGLTAVDVKTVGGIIELNETMGSNAMFYCRAGANETIEVYPDARIRERAYDMVYSPWFDISRNADNGKMVSLSKPLVLKENRASGRTDLISKGIVSVL